MSSKFPKIVISGDDVDVKKCVTKGTSSVLLIAMIAGAVALLFGIIVSYGILLLIILFYPLFTIFLRKKALATIHGSGILVSEKQFPEIHQCVATFKDRLGIKDEISVYIVENNIINAFAVKYGKKNIILLTDDLIKGCLSTNPKALAFVIGHEMGHIALSHNSVIRSYISQHYKKLGRLDEYTADAVATELVSDINIVCSGLLLITVGYALLPYVDLNEVVIQADEVAKNKYSKKAEKTLSHPLLLNRFNKVLQNANYSVETSENI